MDNYLFAMAIFAGFYALMALGLNMIFGLALTAGGTGTMRGAILVVFLTGGTRRLSLEAK